ncbi:DUF2812 domain-containing protein [Clostridium oryzae]|uniref:DUF2812 domain-containing protein n=1 Tax=Clostridium oryzae TaxID=1450648 RepID=A0A1V4IRW5_9CLOT|nr:DUF2812 domain-containing protein [Clostridium oryzae]OPJ62762.1 hypothetical protein CLORY_16420 [Clostridium oryzae]
MSEIKIHKFWWMWQHKKIERWLEEKELNGKKLTRTDYMGSVFYFEECEPQKVTYCIDYANKVTEQYTQFVSEAGWQLFELGFGWVVLRREYAAKKPEFFTDYHSAIRRNKNFMSVFVILFYFLVIQLPGDIRYLFEANSVLFSIIRFVIFMITLTLASILGIATAQFLGTNIVLARKKRI